MEKIVLTADDGSEMELFVEEQTRLNGVNYLLVSDSLDDEANAYILKEISDDSSEYGDYIMVEDDTEFEAVSEIFASMLDEEVDFTF